MSSHSAGGNRMGLRAGLIAILLVLLMLLGGLGYFIATLLEPVGSPDEVRLPEGLEWVRSIYGFGPSAEEQFIAPDHVEISSGGAIWVSDTQLNSIFEFGPDGTLRRRIELSGVVADIPWVVPKGISVSQDGEVYVCANGADRLLVLSRQGELLRSWEVSQPLDCEVAGDRVYVTGPAGVSVFTVEGESVGSWGGRGSSLEQLDLPQGIVVDADGVIYVADTLNARVKAFSSEGDLLWTTDAGITGGGNQAMGEETSEETSGTGLQLPAGMCMDANERLVLVDPFGFNMVVVDKTDGSIIDRYGDFGESDGLFAYPTGIAYDTERDWFVVADTANARVQIVRIPDSGSTELGPTVRRALVGPVWVCAVPLVLLLFVAVMMKVSKSRKSSELSNMEVGEHPDDNF
ncbi:MAG: NHL repeat-containing protein [Coriobacteriia bacterium]|nr:NHL repeat-containing protein [Coriobacteriia bacterium]MBN2822464.1 NHL repeat-containing protein [Coriobacteriia bacterium]